MSTHEPDKEMFDQVKEGIKNLGEILTQWQQKESAIHSLAETNAKQAGAPPEQMDAHVYMHKKALKKAMADKAKQEDPEEQAKAGAGGPGNIQSPQLPMAGQAKNTGANGWEGLMMPTPYPGQGQVQTGAPTQSTGPVTAAQCPMPGMPMPGVPAGGTGTNPMFGAHQLNTLPTASPPLTRTMR